MKTLLQTVASQALPETPIGTVFVIGGGRGMPLHDIRALQPRQLVIAEPRPEAVQALQQRLAPQNELLLAQAVTAHEGDTTDFHVLSNPRYSSVREPTALLRHFPNIQSAGIQEVQAISITHALESLQLTDDGQHLLIIAAPGSAATILEAAPARLLRAFSWIILNSAEEPLYEGDTSLPALSQALTGLGYDPQAEDADTLPPFTNALFRRNTTVVALAQAHAELDELRQHLVFREAEVQSRTEERDTAARETVDLSEKLAYAKAMLAEEHASTQALRAAHDELSADKLSTSAEGKRLTDALNAAQEQLSRNENERLDLQTKLHAEQEALRSARAEIKSCRESLTLAQAKAEGLTRQLAHATEEHSANTKLLEKVRVELDAAKSTADELRVSASDCEGRFEAEKARFLEAENSAASRLSSSESARLELQKKLEAERKALQAACSESQSSKESLSMAQTKMEDLTRQLTAAATEKADGAKRLKMLRSQLDAAESTLDELHSREKEYQEQLQEEKTRFRSTEQELLKATAHLTLIKELLLTRPESH